MLSIFTLKILFTIAILAVTLFAGWYPFYRRIAEDAHFDLPIGDTLATGVFLGAALLHMLPEAAGQFREMGYHYPWAYIIMGAVFLIFLWLEHLGKEMYEHNEANHPGFALLAWGMMCVHALMLGTALGLNNEHSVIIMLFLAIITHKWAESFAIAVQLNRSSLAPRSGLFFFAIFSLMTPIGIFIGWYFGGTIHTHSIFDPILLAASAGTFLYLGTLHGLERCVLVQQCCNLRYFSFVIVGFLIMAWVALYV